MLSDSGIVNSIRYYCQCCNFNVLTSIPDPRIPPKYQTSFVIWSLLVAGFPPGKKSRMLHSKHTIDRGISVIPRHLAKLPEHILTPMFQSAVLEQTPWLLDVFCEF